MAPKKYVSVTHGLVCSGLPDTGVHEISTTKTGNAKAMKRTHFKGSFAQAVKEGKRRTKKLGDGARLKTHGASENEHYYVVKEGKLRSDSRR